MKQRNRLTFILAESPLNPAADAVRTSLPERPVPVTSKLWLVAPPGTLTEEGAEAATPGIIDSHTVTPEGGAGWLKDTVIVAVALGAKFNGSGVSVRVCTPRSIPVPLNGTSVTASSGSSVIIRRILETCPGAVSEKGTSIFTESSCAKSAG
jgi:hypothetical protein